MEQALKVAQENLREIRTVTEWAQEMGYESPKYFSHRFKKKYGVSPKPKLVELRIDRFYELINQDSEISCFEIGQELGIGGETDLNKYVKNHTGKPPREWKNG
ncbi:MAG: helix-turn-helix domain-containing protein [Gracilimonas sp.]|nr:helix-turn-helix domain-containing protein [Gracilimonas sp.]